MWSSLLTSQQSIKNGKVCERVILMPVNLSLSVYRIKKHHQVQLGLLYQYKSALGEWAFKQPFSVGFRGWNGVKQLPSESPSSLLSKEKASASDRFENRGSKEASWDFWQLSCSRLHLASHLERNRSFSRLSHCSFIIHFVQRIKGSKCGVQSLWKKFSV